MPFPNLSTIKRYSSLREPDFPADKRKTHSNPQACEAMKALPVERRLAVNKRIDDRNLENRERRYLVASGALTLDEDEVISDTASHWTIEDQEYETIKNNPEIFERVKDLLPNRWFRCIVETRAKEKIEKENNKGRDLMLARDMNEVPRDLSTFLDLKFPPELFIAANFAYIPLGLFKSKHVRVLQTTAAGTTPKTVYEEGKKTKIWDIAAISKNLDIKSDDFEGCPTFVEFLEAMENYIRFVVDWDRDKEQGKHAQFIYSHGLFFKNPENADLYPYWKGTEKELREDRRTQGFKFDLPTYRDKMQTCRSEYMLTQSLANAAASTSSGRGRFGFRGGRLGGVDRSTGTSSNMPNRFRPFPNSNKKGLTSCCLACAERGHKLYNHPTNRPTLWARLVGRELQDAATGKVICISWNLWGTRGGREGQDGCSGCDKAHVCSFCGKSDHHAFAWECQRDPKNN